MKIEQRRLVADFGDLLADVNTLWKYPSMPGKVFERDL